MRRNNVVIVPAKCQHTGKMYGIRAEKKNDGWHLNWAFELPEDEAARENIGENAISGRIVIDAEYPMPLLWWKRICPLWKMWKAILLG